MGQLQVTQARAGKHQEDIEHIGAQNGTDGHVSMPFHCTHHRRRQFRQAGSHGNDGQADDQLGCRQ